MTRTLFVCVHNAGRSQMAAAFAARIGLEARSASSDPSGVINPDVAQVMAERGFDLTANVPKKLDTADAQWADIVVTMGCGDACPYIPGKQYIDWNLADPNSMTLDEIRELRDDIEQRVEGLARDAARATTEGAST